MKLYFIKDGKQFLLDKEPRELPDGIRDGYLRRTAESARRREWKVSGEGAKFTGVYEPGSDAESRVASVRAAVNGLAEYCGALYFSERIDDVSGIYKKISSDDRSEAIAVSSNDRVYLGLDIFRHRLAVSVMRAGEAHIAVGDLQSFDLSEVTEGHTLELDPVWSRTEPEVLYFSSAGLPENPGEPSEPIMTPAALMSAMNRPKTAPRGPASLCRLDLRSGEFTALLEDERFDFVKPLSAPDGSLYYLKRPYGAEKQTSGGCLADLLMLPVRLARAVLGFFNFFSLKYSGSPLTSQGEKAKNRDAGQIFIDGNLINAERELKANSGDPSPGFIPKSWELRRLKNGSDELVRGGVLCYTLAPDGNIVYSNGKYIIRRAPDGAEETLAKVDSATFLKYLDVE